jgi:nucleotide-binding universal stress UspA family protein
MPDEMQTGLRCVVAASDLSEGSDRAIRAAQAIARAAGGGLHVVHCISQPVFPYWDGLVGEETRAGWIETTRMDLEWQVKRVLEEDVALALEVRIGEPAREVAEYASTVAADMLVVGPHQPRMAFDDLLGSTADRLIRTASVPCMVVNRPLSPPLRQVLFPVDFSAPSRHAVEVGMDLLGESLFARGTDSAPTIVEILFVSAFAAPHLRPLAVQPSLKAQVEEACSRLPSDTRAKLLPRILSAPLPIDGIRLSAERMEADLIVMGTHGHGTLGRALVGSVASAVARTVPVSVLLIPPP